MGGLVAGRGSPASRLLRLGWTGHSLLFLRGSSSDAVGILHPQAGLAVEGSRIGTSLRLKGGQAQGWQPAIVTCDQA